MRIIKFIIICLFFLGCSGGNFSAGNEVAGSAGVAGVAGNSGVAGATAGSPNAGNAGDSGSAGEVSIAGSAGSSGTAGDAGSSGTAGVAGSSGSAGISGSAGSSGSGGTTTDPCVGVVGTTICVDNVRHGCFSGATTLTEPCTLGCHTNGKVCNQCTDGDVMCQVDVWNILQICNDSLWSQSITCPNGCSNGQCNTGGTGGTAGVAGVAGSSGTAGSSGSSGTAGSSGSSGTAGSGGVAGSAGSSGTAGSSGSGGIAGSSGSGGSGGSSDPCANAPEIIPLSDPVDPRLGTYDACGSIYLYSADSGPMEGGLGDKSVLCNPTVNTSIPGQYCLNCKTVPAYGNPWGGLTSDPKCDFCQQPIFPGFPGFEVVDPSTGSYIKGYYQACYRCGHDPVSSYPPGYQVDKQCLMCKTGYLWENGAHGELVNIGILPACNY